MILQSFNKCFFPGSEHSGAVSRPACGMAQFNVLHEMSLLEQVLNPRNMATAQKRVIANKGEAGVDGMKVGELNAFMAKC